MPHILLVDDEMFQRKLIRETLSIEPTYTFTEAADGIQALTHIENGLRPDLIVLDVMMPQMDGLEVCHTLKSNPRYQPIPIILVTALGNVQDKVAGLDAGADDFVNKPFEESELQARVRSALRMKQMHDELEQANKMRDDLVRMIMHDMGNLVAVVSSALSLYHRLRPDSEQAIGYVRDAYEANQSLADLISDALDVSSMDYHSLPVRRAETDLLALARTQLDYFRGISMDSNVVIRLQADEGFDPQANIDPSLIRRVIGNLVTNALKFSPENTEITVQFTANGDNTITIEVTDQGPGIAPDDLQHIFNKFKLAKNFADRRERPGRGLGLTFSKLAVEAHNGTIRVESEPGHGATFVVELPRT